MFKFKFDFDEKKFRKSVEKATEKAAIKHVREQLRGVVCPVHGTSPTVEQKGSIGTKLSWDIHACCDEQLKIVNSRLGAEQSGGKPITAEDFSGRPISAEDFSGRPISADDLGGKQISSDDFSGRPIGPDDLGG
jgi:hypothetical protein